MPHVIDLAPGLSHGLATEPALDAAGDRVAEALGAEAAALAHGFAGAVLLAAMAVKPEGRPVILLAAHDIELAGPLRDLLALAGAAPMVIGSVDRASLADLELALGRGAAAVLYVADAGLARRHLIGLPVLRHAAHCTGVPTIVIAPGHSESEGLLDAGADLLVLDATTAFAGPPVGILAGRADLVAAARRAQAAGLGRLTRPAPDHFAALLACLAATNDAAGAARSTRLAEQLARRPGLSLAQTRPVAVLEIDPAASDTTARDLAHALPHGQPALLVDDRDAAAGRLVLDLRRLDEASFEAVLEALQRALDNPIPCAPWP